MDFGFLPLGAVRFREDRGMTDVGFGWINLLQY